MGLLEYFYFMHLMHPKKGEMIVHKCINKAVSKNLYMFFILHMGLLEKYLFYALVH